MAEISILTTFRNSGAFLGECIGSVLAQRADWELLLWDDGSEDRGLDVARALRGDRVHLVGSGRLGRCRALAMVLAAATGRYVWVLDADDKVLPRGVPTMLEAMGRMPWAHVGVFGYNDVDGAETRPGSRMRFGNDPDTLVEGRGLWMFHPVMLREALVAAGGFGDVDGAEDYDTALRLEEAEDFAFLRSRLVVWSHRAHAGQYSRTNASMQRDGVHRAVRLARARRAHAVSSPA